MITITTKVSPTIVDLVEVISLLNTVFSQFPDFESYSAESTFSRLSQSKYPVAFLAHFNSVLVGFALCYERYPRFLHLWELGVDSSFRNQGIASRLYESIEEFARSQKLTGVTMNTFNRYKDSLRLAIKRGYEIYNIEKEGVFAKEPKLNLHLVFSYDVDCQNKGK